MTISKKHKLVLLAAILFAAGSTFFMLVLQPASPKGLHHSCFKTERGWGYDVLFNDRIIIHQPFIPGKPGVDGFATEQEAADRAKTVIESIKSGNDPLFGQKPLQRTGVSDAQSKQ